jgi:hypothetical protein
VTTDIPDNVRAFLEELTDGEPASVLREDIERIGPFDPESWHADSDRLAYIALQAREILDADYARTLLAVIDDASPADE